MEHPARSDLGYGSPIEFEAGEDGDATSISPVTCLLDHATDNGTPRQGKAKEGSERSRGGIILGGP